MSKKKTLSEFEVWATQFSNYYGFWPVFNSIIEFEVSEEKEHKLDHLKQLFRVQLNKRRREMNLQIIDWNEYQK